MAGSSKFNVDITANNKTAAGIKSARSSFETLTKPVSILEQATGRFAKNGLGEMIGQVGTLRKSVSDAFGGVFDAANAAGVLGGAAEAAGAGVGILGVALVATTVAATRFSAPIARSAAEIGRTSKMLGIGAKDLQDFRGAAELNGVAASAMDSALEGVGDTLNDARWGRNNQALQLMNQLGIRTHYTKGGLIDTRRAMLDIADAMARQTNPQTQALIANTFGAGAAFQFLQRGSAAMQADMARYAASGAEFTDDQIKGSTAYSRSLQQLGNQWRGLTHDLAEKVLIPWTQPLIDDLSKALGLIDKIIDGKKTLGQSAASALNHVERNPWGRTALNLFGRAIGLPPMMFGPDVGMGSAERTGAAIGKSITDWFSSRSDAFGQAIEVQSGTLTPASYSRSAGPAVAGVGFRTAFEFFRKRGWSTAQAAGIAQNLVDESGVSPNPVGSNDNGRAYGVAQWHSSRQADFARWAGRSIVGSSLSDQLGFVQYELTQGRYAGVGAQLSAAQTAAAAAALISRLYEAPAGGDAEAAARGDRATSALASMSDTAGKVEVNIRLRTDQPATTMIKTSGGVRATAGVEYSMTGSVA